MLKSNQNDGTQLGWHGIGTWSTTQINVTWNTYEGRSAVNAVGYIAVCKVQEQWGLAVKTSKTATFPIAFSSTPYLVLAIEYSTGVVDGNTFAPQVGTITSRSTEFVNYDRDKYYFAIGK